MKITKVIALLTISLFATTITHAQEVIRKVENVTILSLDGKDTQIPYWGEKNIMIFYIDPDRAAQNQKFIDDLDESKRAEGENLVGMGIMNLKDAPFIPNRLARAIAEKRGTTNNALVLSDENRTLSTEWELGDCNNKFVTILINRDCEIIYVKKGEFTPEEEEELLLLIDKLK
ncbi:MAG: hypothetical protein R3Y39_05600 [Rikenellaceae bacterium]